MTDVTQLKKTGHVRYTPAGYAVWFNGQRCSPLWTDVGPARAYLDALIKGTRQPEYEEEETK